MPTDPIPTPVDATLSPGLQQLISRLGTTISTAFGTWLMGKGWVSKDDADFYTTFIGGIAVLLLGNIVTYVWSNRYRFKIWQTPANPDQP